MIPADRPRVLVACLGNIFLGDDAFGVEVARRLAARPLPEGVRVVDFGSRGLDLAYALLDGCQAAVLVDAAPRDGPPGTLYVLELDAAATTSAPASEAGPLPDAHGLDPARALALVRALGGTAARVLLVGCEPAPFIDDDLPPGLSAPVEAAVGEAAALVEALAARLLLDPHADLEENVDLAKEADPCPP